jgi:hypothetical protein
MTHDGRLDTGAFDERCVGLDHLAFRVTDSDELQQWATHFDAMGVRIRGSSTSGTDPLGFFATQPTFNWNCLRSRISQISNLPTRTPRKRSACCTKVHNRSPARPPASAPVGHLRAGSGSVRLPRAGYRLGRCTGLRCRAR